MDPAVTGLATFAVTSCAVLLGAWLHRALPEAHLADASKDTIKAAVGFIATMTALVLSLVTASAKTSFDEVATAVKHSAVEILALDRALGRYGDEAADLRVRLKGVVATTIATRWPEDARPTGAASAVRSDAATVPEHLGESIRALVPRNEAQRALQGRSLELAESLLQARWVAVAAAAPSVPLPFLVVLLFWLAVTFTSYGMFAPRNATVVTMLLLCSASVAAALFLVLEMDSPFHGLLRVSADPLRHALERIGQ